MIEIERSAILPASADNMFELINDIEAYPAYMSGCDNAEILEQDETSMVARLHVRKAGMSQSFTTRNELKRPESITLNLIEGPFSHFEGQWQITALGEQASKVVLRLEFTVRSKLAGKALERLFRMVADEMVEAISSRAQQYVQ